MRDSVLDLESFSDFDKKNRIFQVFLVKESVSLSIIILLYQILLC